MSDLYDEILSKNPRWHREEYPSITIDEVAKAQGNDAARKNELIEWAYCELRVTADALEQVNARIDVGLRSERSLNERIVQLEAALREIAEQPLSCKLEPGDCDFEGGYDCCINTARKAFKDIT